MANLLTAGEGAAVLRVETTHADMLNLLPLVDDYIKDATGFDWVSLGTIPEKAKAAARMLLVMWFEDPGQAGGLGGMPPFGLVSVLAQLEALALRYKTFGGGYGAGFVVLAGAKEGDTVASVEGLVGVTGDQSAKFESVISRDGYLRQISGENLDECYFRVCLVPLGGV
jgi:hypothetical protein